MVQSDPSEFNASVMNETWDMSNELHLELLEKQRRFEEERALERKRIRQQRGIWRKIVDSIVPA
jgi:hypothetical protein